ncbi:hypothetical protein [Micromonospora sp. IBHARD004]|uniref:hypothetical protein n=1 Tax=Micromonospora sp. IBHARD004 TaxID=3457764 RepID=UPI0040599914
MENPGYTGRQVWIRQYTDHAPNGRGQKAKLRADATAPRVRPELGAGQRTRATHAELVSRLLL